MKIDGFGGGNRIDRKGAAKAKGANKKSVASSPASPASTASDEIRIAPEADSLMMIQRMVDQSPDIRVEEVDRIVGELKSGKYKVSFEQVAEAFIKEALVHELSKRGSR